MPDVVTKEYLSAKETAQQLGVSRSTIHNLLRDRRITHFRIGSKIRVPAEAVTAFVESTRREARAA